MGVGISAVVAALWSDLLQCVGGVFLADIGCGAVRRPSGFLLGLFSGCSCVG